MEPPRAPISPIMPPATAVVMGQRRGTSWKVAPLPAPRAAKQSMNRRVVPRREGAAVRLKRPAMAISRTTERVVMPPMRSASQPPSTRVAAGEEIFADAEAIGEGEEDVEVRAGVTGRGDDAVHLADAPLGVGVGAFLFAPDGGGEDEVGELAGGGGVEAILDDEEVDGAQGLLEKGVVGEGDGGVGGNEPQGLDAAGDGGLDDVGVGEASF